MLVLREFGALRSYRDSRGLQLGDAVPDFVAQSIAGAPVRSSDLRNRVLLFLSKDCPACEEVITSLRQISAADLPPMAVAVVSSRTSAGWLDERLAFLDAAFVFLDERRRVASKFRVVDTPFAFAINSAGRIGARKMPHGASDLFELRALAT